MSCDCQDNERLRRRRGINACIYCNVNLVKLKNQKISRFSVKTAGFN